MPTASWALLVVAGVAAVADWVAVVRRPSAVEQVAKPLVLVALIGVAVTLDPEHDAQRAWFVVALVLSLAGDVFLLPKPDLFVPGLASFLLGHVAYAVGFADAGGDANAGLGVLVVLAFVGTRVMRAVGRTERALLGPVAAYIAVIGAMVAFAITHGDPVGIGGAILFAVSDSILAINRFEHERRRGPLAVMVTYHLAQGLLVLSLLP